MKFLKSAFCRMFGHDFNYNEIGYGGGDFCDVWCNRCDHRFEFPVSVLKFRAPDVYKMYKELKND